ncbi:12061_t:CDS:2 [Funneliformis caledonium]|uniref:12061_t:CDS:1 n=1 Tax=Funneliformis caledonium TaxID=1117310 RepID=A0A9N8W7A3_9GLOM|nr:12061_t:CDS:2 [Funneliformis caledonium]
MTKESTLTFEVHSPSSPIIIPTRKSTPSRMSPITGNPILADKMLTSKESSPDLATLSSSPAPLNPITNKNNNTLAPSRFPSYSSSYSSPSSSTTRLMTKGFHSTTRLPDTINIKESERIENFSERPKRNTMKRSLSSKETKSLHFTPTFVRNPFNDCEIFSLELSNSDESKLRTNDSNTLNDNESVSLRDKNKERINYTKDYKSNHRNSWDIIELLALDNFRNWILCFCVINFDLELGQAMDLMYPPSELIDDEKKNICFSAFPDSNSFDVGDTVFNFRIRCSQSGLVSSGPTADAGFLYGYVFFRQKKDSRIRRGYFQKSLVILSQYPYVGLFSKMVSILGPTYFDVGKPMLEAACHDIASWKSPLPGNHFDLPFLGNVLQVEIPQPNKPQLLETCPFDMANYRPETQILASLPPVTMFTHFRDMLKDLWLCWELMLFAEPIVLMAPDPKICSESVIELVDLINPIPYCGDYRPYFTIQDSDFKSFVTKNKPPSNIIIGVTNPFFTKALQHWPNIIRVGKSKSRKQCDSSWKRLHGVTSKRKSVIAKDKAILKLLAEAIARGYPSDYLLNNILRRYFVELTEKFLVPLNRYFSTLIPFHITLSSSQEPPQLKPFKTDVFLKSLQEHGPQIPFKSKNFPPTTTDTYLNFYAQFLKCGNFATWLRQRTTEAQNELRKRYLQVLCDDDVKKWMIGKHEMELVDLLVRVKDELRLSNKNDSSSQKSSSTRDNNGVPPSIPTSKQREKLKLQANIIISGLSRDLRESLAVGTL